MYYWTRVWSCVEEECDWTGESDLAIVKPQMRTWYGNMCVHLFWTNCSWNLINLLIRNGPEACRLFKRGHLLGILPIIWMDHNTRRHELVEACLHVRTLYYKKKWLPHNRQYLPGKAWRWRGKSSFWRVIYLDSANIEAHKFSLFYTFMCSTQLQIFILLFTKIIIIVTQ